MQGTIPDDPPGTRAGPPDSWRFPELEALRDQLAALPKQTKRILFFVPNNHRLQAPPDGPVAAVSGPSASAAPPRCSRVRWSWTS